MTKEQSITILPGFHKQLLEAYATKFHKIKISYTRLDSIQLTCFPVDPNKQYEIYTVQRVTDVTVENLVNTFKTLINEKDTATFNNIANDLKEEIKNE